ncbi:16S rRNA (uracil(1498)-N(3))-methyltransferase [Micromonospora sp. NBC_01813]|uniref:16S rRNA (uracil(1498)-N(3))-methyltransferase n=1 Tax=Micromonospora sp. NBC_01813 TaxID=2975988 RepID=UPI002DD8D66B|nr:16S rRNA (uracil(1498)-N(3))-methyltransferase [Micromonospora sp. NBC_01813]WSA09315.1 16S rRNA (uracil(1498)-N(3))-methyltransferase [Micromonospora sp. NBC_01813]
MSAPLFVVERLPAGPTYTLDGPEGRHAATVTRLRAGESVLLADGRGGIAHAVVAQAGRHSLDLRIVHTDFTAAADPRLVVVQGIAKGDRGELAVQAMTEVGVDEIVPWAAVRSVTRWRDDRGVRSRQRWVSTAREAAKQARRAWLPAIGGSDQIPAESTAAVAARLSAATAAFVLHESAEQRLAGADLPTTGSVLLVVGPEGGIDDAELTAFTAAGARVVRLGEQVLRTSTAGVAALAVLCARLGRW